MKNLRTMLAFGLLLCNGADVLAGDVVLPSDVSIALTAEPSFDLQSGQRVTFTLSVVNHGPEPVDNLVIRSSAIYDELDVFSNSSSHCQGDMILTVVDLVDTFYFSYGWFPVSTGGPPVAVGEIRTCHLSLDFTQWAPPVFPVTFAMSSYETDIDPANNSATVFLRRPVVAKPIPTLSSMGLALLAGLLAMSVALRRRSRSPALGRGKE